MASLKQKKGTRNWIAVVRIPSAVLEVAPHVFKTKTGTLKTHLQKSTGTSDKRIANKLANAFQVECDQLFEPHLTGTSSGELITQPASNQLTNVRRFLQAQSQHPDVTQHLLIDHAMNIIKQVGMEHDAEFVREKLAQIRSGLTPEQTRQWLELEALDQGIPINGNTLAEIEKATLSLHDTRITLGQIFDRYIERRKAQGPIKEKTLKRAQTTFEALCKALPEGAKTKAEHLTIKRARDWCFRYQQTLKARGNSLTTVQNNIDAMTPAFSMAEDDGLIARNPFKKYRTALAVSKRGTKMNQSNRSWINEDLPEETLYELLKAAGRRFGSTSAVGYMMPLMGLALYTGARIEELCRLTREDVKVKPSGQVRYIDITEAKSEAGIREIPLLPVASKIVNHLLAKLPPEEQRLFPSLIARDDRYSHAPSNEFSRFKKSFGYTKKAEYTFHSFRSTVITLLHRAGISDDFISMMVGHTEGRNTLAKRVYSAGHSLETLAQTVTCIEYEPRIESLLLETASAYAPRNID